MKDFEEFYEQKVEPTKLKPHLEDKFNQNMCGEWLFRRIEGYHKDLLL